MDLKALKQSLFDEYKYKIELHAHTFPASRCSQISPYEMAKTYKELGYDAVTIANHFIYEYEHPDKLKDRTSCINRFIKDFDEIKTYEKEFDIKFYFAAEIRFTENNNDYLIFGLNKEMVGEIYDILPYGVEHFRNTYNLKDSVFVQAHPFRDGMEDTDSSLLDGIEVFNMHPGHNSRIGIAAKHAKKEGVKIITSGSDFHHPNRNHEGVSAIKCKYLPNDSFELASILKSGDYLIEIGNSLILP